MGVEDKDVCALCSVEEFEKHMLEKRQSRGIVVAITTKSIQEDVIRVCEAMDQVMCKDTEFAEILTQHVMDIRKNAALIGKEGTSIVSRILEAAFAASTQTAERRRPKDYKAMQNFLKSTGRM